MTEIVVYECPDYEQNTEIHARVNYVLEDYVCICGKKLVKKNVKL